MQTVCYKKTFDRNLNDLFSAYISEQNDYFNSGIYELKNIEKYNNKKKTVQYLSIVYFVQIQENAQQFIPQCSTIQIELPTKIAHIFHLNFDSNYVSNNETAISKQSGLNNPLHSLHIADERKERKKHFCVNFL